MKRSYLFYCVLFFSSCAFSENEKPIDIYRNTFLSEMTFVYGETVNKAGGLSLHGSHKSHGKHHSETTESVQATTDSLATSIKITDCHMQAMALYPQNLQQVAYQKAANGGNIEQSRLAFVAAIEQQITQSEQKQQEFDALAQRFVKQANQCIARALEGTPLSAYHNH